jgi:hypothetical protein
MEASFVGGSGGAVYCKRNKNVPKMLAKAKGNNDAKLQVAKLFVAAIQSPKLQANTLLSAMQVWARRPPYTVLGPSGKAAAKADMLKAQEAYAVATAVWADAAARLDAAQTKVDAQKAAMAKIKAEFEVPAQGTTNLEEFNAVLAGHVEANFTKRMAIASKVEAAAAQKAVDTAKETAAATVPVEDATQEFEQCRTQVNKAFRKVTTKAAQLAAAKAAFLAWA